MRKVSIVVFAAALALGACKKEEKGASTDKKEPSAKTNGDDKKEPAAPAPATTDTAPAKEQPQEQPPAAAPPPAAAGDSITLQNTMHAVGDKWTEEKSQSMDMMISAQGQQVPMTGVGHEVKNWEVLAVSDEAITKAKVSYTTVERSQKLGGQEKLPPSALAGKSYTLEAGDPIKVSTDAGPAADAEAKEVQDAEKSFGKPDKMNKLLAGKTFAKDQAVDLPPAEIAQSMGDDPSMTVKKMTLTYRGMDGDLALFDMAVSLEQSAGGGKLDMELTGKAKVDPKTSDDVEMELDGKMSMTGPATAEGTMKMTESHTKI